MKHYGYTAKESTAWCRVCRPGSVVGPQQQFLADIEKRMIEEGRRYRADRAQLSNRDDSVPPIGKPPVGVPASGSLWAGRAAVPMNTTGRPLHLPISENTERRPSTGDGATRGQHRSHAYHEIPASRSGSRQGATREQETDFKRNKSEANGLAKSLDLRASGSRSGSRPRSNSRSSNGSAASNKLRSSLNGSPYSSSTPKRTGFHR